MARLGRRDGIDYSKKGIGSVYPEKVIDAAPSMDRIEPFLTADLFESRFLFGIPLVSPLTKQKMTKDQLKDAITRAANRFEIDTKVDIFPVIRRYKLPFEHAQYQQYIYLEIPNKPIQQVCSLTIRSASYSQSGQPFQIQSPAASAYPPPFTPPTSQPQPNDTAEDDKYPAGNIIYSIPNEWIEMANASRGILNVNPLNPAFNSIGIDSQFAGAGSIPLHFLGQHRMVPAYWVVEALIGIGTQEGQVPVAVNEAVGAMATILVLDLLIPGFRISSQSLGIDNLSQSVNDNLMNLLTQKRQNAVDDYNRLCKQFKMMTSNKVFSTNV